VFGQLPDRHAVGMAIIIGSGLYVALRHRAHKNEEPDSAIECSRWSGEARRGDYCTVNLSSFNT
jgi:hypothetical protein